MLDFALLKKQLGINGDYVERAGDVYSPDFNPKRNITVLEYDEETMRKKAEYVLYSGRLCTRILRSYRYSRFFL